MTGRRARSRSGPARAALPVLVATIWACHSPGDGRPPARADLPNVLLITIDTLRVDRLTCYGGPPGNSPRIDALAADGVRFARVQAPRGLTWPSLTSLMTGVYPRTHQVRLNGSALEERHETLPEILHEAGYDTGGFIANMCDAPNRGLDTFFCAWWEDEGRPEQRVRRMWASHDQPKWDRSLTREAREFIRRPRDRPFFAWLHYIDPHKPYDVVEEHVRDEYDGSFPPDEDVIDQRTLDAAPLTAAERVQLMAAYDSQVTGVDAHVGTLLDALDETGIADNTLVILSADHGEELGDHHVYFYHLASVYQQVLAAPWILRWPARLPVGRVVADDVQVIDIAPTVLDLLDLPAPAGIEGASRLGLARGEPGAAGAAVTFAEWQDQMVIVGRGRWRFIWNPNGLATQGLPFSRSPDRAFVIGERELYDLETDPLQLRDVAGEHPDLVEELLALACGFVQEKPFLHVARGAIPDAVRERLEALGYVQDTDAGGADAGIAHHCPGAR